MEQKPGMFDGWWSVIGYGLTIGVVGIILWFVILKVVNL